MGKYLKYLLLIFICVIVAEIGYYYYISSFNKTNTETNLNSSYTYIQSASPTQRPIVESALAKDTVNQLLFLKKGILQSSQIINTYKGSITKLSFEKGVNNNNFAFTAELYLEASKGAALNYFFNDNDLLKLKVFSTVGTEKQIKLSDLKVGDEVEFMERLDLMKGLENNAIEYKVTKISGSKI